MRILIACLLACCLQSCLATAGDLQEIMLTMAEGEANVAEKLDEYEAGAATYEEVLDAEKEKWADTRDKVEEVGQAVVDRTKESITGIGKAADGGAIGILTFLVSRFAINAERDRRRRKRKEPVAIPETPTPPTGA